MVSRPMSLLGFLRKAAISLFFRRSLYLIVSSRNGFLGVLDFLTFAAAITAFLFGFPEINDSLPFLAAVSFFNDN
jgi:hypothetical protein